MLGGFDKKKKSTSRIGHTRFVKTTFIVRKEVGIKIPAGGLLKPAVKFQGP